MQEKERSPFNAFDVYFHALQGRATLNISPPAVGLACCDWALHLLNAPGKQAEILGGLQHLVMENLLARLERGQGTDSQDEEKQSVDHRFDDSSWQKDPFRTFYRFFLSLDHWWQTSAAEVQGVTPHHTDVVKFIGKQMLDLVCPYNYVGTNPEILKLTLESNGLNLAKGMANYLDDLNRIYRGLGPNGAENFIPGKTVARTPGRVVHANRLMELILYSPATDRVHGNPVLIVPAWIMKFYILDLSPENSLVRYLVDKGHTVFMISWKNPDHEDRETSMDDYLNLGIMAAMDAITRGLNGRKIHSVGYCLGGTLLAIAGAAMARDGDDRMKTMTLLAAQTDFTDAGELMLFVDHAQVTYLEHIMECQDYLDTTQMAGAFQLLRSNDLIWSRIVSNYLRGEPRPMNDLMAWNADATRMPYRMHSRYLRELFLNNRFFDGKFKVKGNSVAVSDIHVPVFMVATEKDHVAPWFSVYKFLLSSDAPSVTFLLTSGGHNAGIISEPDHPRRHYRVSTMNEGDKYVPPERWFNETPVKKGSWWIPWQNWLARNSGVRVAPPIVENVSDKTSGTPAPGNYVFGK